MPTEKNYLPKNDESHYKFTRAKIRYLHPLGPVLLLFATFCLLAPASACWTLLLCALMWFAIAYHLDDAFHRHLGFQTFEMKRRHPITYYSNSQKDSLFYYYTGPCDRFVRGLRRYAYIAPITTVFVFLLTNLIAYGNPIVLASIVGTMTTLLLFSPLVRALVPKKVELSDVPLRGTILKDFSQALKRSKHVIHPLDPGLSFGGLQIPTKDAQQNFLFIGSVGSGKTTLIRLLQERCLDSMHPGSGVRAVWFDVKNEALPYLTGYGFPKDQILYVNPFDLRSSRWNLQLDVVDNASALEISAILIPSDQVRANQNHQFFLNASRAMLTEVLVYLKNNATKFSLRDVVQILQSKERLLHVLYQTQRGRDAMASYLGDDGQGPEGQVGGIVASVRAYLTDMLAPIAACWDHAQTEFSLHDWINSEKILVLSFHPQLREQTTQINAILFHRAVQLVLSQGTEERPTWFFCDEVNKFGRLDLLETLLTTGRQKGSRVVLGYQDHESSKAIYHDFSGPILGQCNSLALLRVVTSQAANWASELLGDYEHAQYGANEQVYVEKRRTVLPSELQSLPPAGARYGITGIFTNPHIGAWKANIPFKNWPTAWERTERAEPGFLGRPPDHQESPDYTDEDYFRLGLPPLPSTEKPHSTPLPTPADAPPAEEPSPANPPSDEPLPFNPITHL